MKLVLVLVEATDLIFAIDSIPAIFGITRDPFLVFTSNIFAVLGLRSLFFLLATVVTKFHLLKYGLAVTGRAHPKFLLTNAGAVPGDQLILTKPVGNGILATAAKRGKLSAEAQRPMLDAMKTLNGAASRAALAVGSRCATDITGFGLLGHMSHIARASKVTLRLQLAAIPLFPGVREAVRAGSTTDGAKRNAEYLKDLVRWKKGNDEDRAILWDPQTSGGLLVCVGASRAPEYLSRIAGSVVIGEVIERGEVAIEVQ